MNIQGCCTGGCDIEVALRRSNSLFDFWLMRRTLVSIRLSWKHCKPSQRSPISMVGSLWMLLLVNLSDICKGDDWQYYSGDVSKSPSLQQFQRTAVRVLPCADWHCKIQLSFTYHSWIWLGRHRSVGQFVTGIYIIIQAPYILVNFQSFFCNADELF